MQSINEWIDSQQKQMVVEADADGLFKSQKAVDAAKKALSQKLSVIAAMKDKKSKEWEYDIPNMLREMSDEWNKMLESCNAHSSLKIMKYQGVLVDCLACLWGSLVALSVGQEITPGYRALGSFTKLAKALFAAYDKVLLVKPIKLKI